MRIYFFILFMCANLYSQSENNQFHCGYDFSTYLVVETIVNGKKEILPDLKISIIDFEGNLVLNENNKFSYKNANESLLFQKNYKILPEGSLTEKWFFPYADESYFLVLNNDFPFQDFKIKITDLSGKFKTIEQNISVENFYKLCALNAKTGKQFGPKSNIAIKIYLEKN